MRLTAGSFRELHWHTADEWSIMLYGNARVTCLNPDGTVFIGDVAKVTCGTFQQDSRTRSRGWNRMVVNLFWYSIKVRFRRQHLSSFRLGEAHAASVLSKNFGLPVSALKNLPNKSLYIFPAGLPASLAQDKSAVGGRRVESPTNTPSEWRLWPPRSKRVVFSSHR